MEPRGALAAGLLAGMVLGSHVTGTEAQTQPNVRPKATVVDRVSGTRLGDARPAEYGYPFRDPYLATMTAALLNADGLTPGLKRQVVHVPVLSGRNHLPGLEGRGEVSVALYRQHRAAPLMFILSGIGSNPYFGLATYYASLFHHQGFHVVILPSPMTWNFALAASRSGAPGYPPEDARDVYEVMQKTLGVLKNRYNVKVTAISFMGASLGALEGAYLSVIDAGEGKIGIERYLLVNPPIDLSYALQKLEEWDGLQDKFGKERSDTIRSRARGIVERYAQEKRDDPTTVDRFAKEFSSFTPEELQFLIVEYVQTMLPELVYVTQVIQNPSTLTAGTVEVRKRLLGAKAFTLMEYQEKIAIPSWRRAAIEPQADTESLTRRGSLMAILDRLRADSRVYVMHNADDILIDRRSVEALQEAMGDRMILYPLGGHLGNLWYWQNKESILKLFRGSRESSTSGG
jgi:hypothetical protein